jgi:hypothetical protein
MGKKKYDKINKKHSKNYVAIASVRIYQDIPDSWFLHNYSAYVQKNKIERRN